MKNAGNVFIELLPVASLMRAKAVLMALAMMTTALAGCTGGTDGVPEVDEDALNELISANLQDFINNTTVVVNQDFHYHNNTTVVQNSYTYDNDTTNEYDNTTNIDGGEVVNNYEQNDFSNTSYSFGNAGTSFGTVVNGTGGGASMMFVAHVVFSGMDLFPNFNQIDYRNNSFTYNYTYYDYLTNQDRTEDFTFSCSVYYLIGSLSNGSSFQVSYWENSNNYYNAWDNEYNNTIADMLQSASNSHQVRMTCDEDYIAAMPIATGGDGYEYNFLSINVPEGYAIQYLQLTASHRWFGCTDRLNSSSYCQDSYHHSWQETSSFYTYSEGLSPVSTNQYTTMYGGWDNITVDFELDIRTYGEYCCLDSSSYQENPNDPYYTQGYGRLSVWPSSTYEFTLYYQFIPVVPVE